MELYTPIYSKKSQILNISGVDVTLPERPAKSQIFGFDRPKADQRWRRTEKPRNWGTWTPSQKRNFVEREWNRRENGFWFYNNGVPTYITGTHYFYLNYWQPKTGFLEYRYTDREFFLIWDYVVKQRHIHGLIFIKRRREGASTKAGCINYEIVSRVNKVNSGIQSMEEKHAKMLFQNMIVSPMLKLVNLAPFFKPHHAGSTRPQDEIHFAIPSERITKKKLASMSAQIDDWSETSLMGDDGSLDSRITFGPANEKHYDGYEMVFYWGDEIGKTGGKVNVSTRHDIVKHSIENNDEIVGKILYTSTVEEMEKDGAAACKQIWDDSDFMDVDAFMQTRSGLIRYFNPAWRGYKLDKYGNDILTDDGEVLGRVILEEKRRRLREAGNRDKLNGFMRKYPFSINEAFLPKANECLFDSMILDERHLEITELEAEGAAPYVRGKLVWKGGVKPMGNNSALRPSVIWVPDPTGFFLMSRQFDTDDVNNTVWSQNGGHWTPGLAHARIAGVDPYDYTMTTNVHTESKGAGAVFQRYNPLGEEDAGRFSLIYKGRPSTNQAFYDDMVKMCVFCGCKAILEKNKIRCYDYFIAQGWGAYIEWKLKLSERERNARPSRQSAIEKTGEYTTIAKKQAMAEVIESYIFYNCHLIDFKEILEEYRVVTIETATKYDLFIATGLALLGNIYAKRKPIDSTPPVYNIVERFKIT